MRISCESISSFLFSTNHSCTQSKWFVVALLVASAVCIGGIGFFVAGQSPYSALFATCLGAISIAWMVTSSLDYALLRAAENGEVKKCRGLLFFGANVNAINEQKQTPLHIAAIHENVEIIRILLNQDCIINAKDSDLRTPLHYAVESGSLEAVQLFLAHEQIDVNAKDQGCISPLRLALKEEIANALLTHEKIEIGKDAAGETALHLVVERKFLSCVLLLLERKDVNVNETNGTLGRTALHYAANLDENKNTKQIVQVLRECCDVDVKDSQGKTALDFSIKKGNGQIAKIISDKKVETANTIKNKEKESRNPSSNPFIEELKSCLKNREANRGLR